MTDILEPRSYRARWVVPIEGPAIEAGCVSVANARIIAVGKEPTGAVTDLGDGVIAPGFVNAHTHLDLAGTNQVTPCPDSFPDWLRAVIGRRDQTRDADIRRAIDAMIESGTTLVGDIATGPASARRLAERQIPAVVFREVLGRTPQRYEPLWEAAFGATSEPPNDWVQRSVSPHAPYSTALEIYRRSARLDGVVCTHWFESEAEREFLATGAGPMREFLQALGALEADPPIGSADPWTDYLLAPGPAKWLLTHVNFLSASDRTRLFDASLRERLAGVVYCPRTHHYFGLPPHPWRALRALGIPVALGTDSRASNPDLRVYEEARFLARHSQADPVELLEMLTLAGARVLGKSATSGSLVPGKRADLVYLSASGPAELFAPSSRVAGTMIAGEWRYGPTTSGARRGGDMG